MLSKALLSIVVTVEGKLILFTLPAPLKISDGIVVIPFAKVTSVSVLIYANGPLYSEYPLLYMVNTEEGIVAFARDVYQNALAPMVFSEEESWIEERLELL